MMGLSPSTIPTFLILLPGSIGMTEDIQWAGGTVNPGDAVWTDTPPEGRSIDESGIFGISDPATDGVPQGLTYVDQNPVRNKWANIACSHDGVTLKCHLNGAKTELTTTSKFRPAELSHQDDYNKKNGKKTILPYP